MGREARHGLTLSGSPPRVGGIPERITEEMMMTPRQIADLSAATDDMLDQRARDAQGEAEFHETAEDEPPMRDPVDIHAMMDGFARWASSFVLIVLAVSTILMIGAAITDPEWLSEVLR